MKACLQNLMTSVVITMMASMTYAETETSWREEYAYMMGKQAYTYGFPAINFANVRYDWVEGHSSSFRAVGNAYSHYPKLVDPEYQYGTSMNRDTLYSMAWSYVGDEPLVFTIPENPDDRYYSIEFTEWYTDAFGYMGNRTTHNKAAAYLVHAPGWEGEIPDGIDKVLKAPTPWFLAVGRTYTSNTPEDLEVVHQIQQGYKIYPLSEWGKENPREAKPIRDVLDVFPADDPLGKFKTMNAAMKENPPPARDLALMQQFALVGLGPLAEVDLDALDPDIRQGLARAITDGHAYLQKVSEAMGSITGMNREVNGWSYNPANWGRMAESGDFLGRSATQALSGGIENLIEEAVKLRTFTDSNGKPLDGSRRYVLKFSEEQIPQVDAFWSITLYDNRFNLVRNDAGKYAIRDIDPNLSYGEDGSLTIYLQSEAPTEENANWIPTPQNGAFNLFFRAYLPDQAFIDQTYIPPAIELID
jgi:hypothetical protein